MASVVLTVADESMLFQIKKACSLLKGVSEVKVIKPKASNKEITLTKGYKEAMNDIQRGRVYHAESTEDMFQQILENV